MRQVRAEFGICLLFCQVLRLLSMIKGKWLDCDLLQMGNLTKEEFVHVLRRQSTGFPRGSSKFRGVTLHKCGRWEARMGQFLGKKYSIFLSFSS